MRSRRDRVLGLAGLLVGVALLVGAVIFAVSGSPSRTHSSPKKNSSTSPSAEANTPFAQTSIWNARLVAGAALASNSQALVAELQRQVTRYGTWINTESYSTPIYTVSASLPRTPVTLDMPTTYASAVDLAKTFRAGVPIPAGARPAPGTDGDLVVWQPATDTMWELWKARQVDGVWHARWGGRMDHVSQNPGYFTDPPDWGTAATSLALVGGTMRISELRAGHIDHALAISIPRARYGVYASPAQRSDGNFNSPTAIPEGTRFRLDPRLDLNALHLPPVTRMIAEAAQRYGLFVRDQGGSVSFYGEQVTQPGVDPYTRPGGLFGTLSPAKIAGAFPWSHLEAVSAPVHAYH